MPTDAVQMIREFGVPISMLIAIFAGIWQVLRWLAPRCDRVIDSHTEFVGSLEKEVRQHTELLGEIRDAVREHGQRIEQLPCVREPVSGDRHLSAG